VLSLGDLRTARRRTLTWLRNDCPLLKGSVEYFGSRVFFPPHSEVARTICWGGVFEPENVGLLCRLATGASLVLDVGANIGTMALPILQHNPLVRVLSLEPSPNSTPYLKRTLAASPYRERWEIVEKAACEHVGSTEFFVAEEKNGAFDALVDTGRGGHTRRVAVQATTLDTEWTRLGKPLVSVVKIDVEGAELGVLAGAVELLASERPVVVTEWAASNLRATQSRPSRLLESAAACSYRVHVIPTLERITDAPALAVALLRTESFLLWPAERTEPW
jgi:FkbM family methyltransferase